MLRKVRLRDGLELAYRTWGPSGAPPLILLHGGGLSMEEWRELAPALARSHRVVAFDARGCGESDWDPEGRYGAATIADDLEELRRELDLQRFALLGHSFGAVAACLYAAHHPERVEALVMLDAGPIDRTVPVALEQPPPRAFARREDAAAALAASLPRGIPDWYLDARFVEQPDGTLTWRGDMAGRIAWARRGGEPRLPTLWREVRTLRVPTLVVRGAESRLFPRENAIRMTEVNPLVELVEVPEAGHFVHLEQPAALLAAIERLLAR